MGEQDDKIVGKRVVPPSERFHSIAIDLMDFVRDVLLTVDPPIKMKGFEMACLVITAYDEDELAKDFIKKSHSQWDHIKSKDMAYFKANGLNLTANRYKEKMKTYFDVIFSGKIEKEKIEEFWEILHSLVRSSIHCLHEDNSLRPEKLQKSDEELAKEWNVNLNHVVYETAESVDSESEDEESEDESESD